MKLVNNLCGCLFNSIIRNVTFAYCVCNNTTKNIGKLQKFNVVYRPAELLPKSVEL